MLRKQLMTMVIAATMILAPLEGAAQGMTDIDMKGAVTIAVVLFGSAALVAVVVSSVNPDDDASETPRECLVRCEEEARTCHDRALWHLFNAERARKACERPRRECRRKCEAARPKSTPAPSPASGPSIRPASAPATKPAMQPSTPPAAVDEPGLHVSLTPFVAPSPSGDTRYGLAVVGRF